MMSMAQNLAYQNAPSNLSDIFLTWQPKVRFALNQGRYTIKTAENSQEFEATIRLRTKVFLEEFAGKSVQSELDIDAIDRQADFLIIIDNESGETIASYRLISSLFSDEFYSQSEFNLRDFLSHPGIKLELSRACIRADKRNSGIFLHLLWKGLAEYIRRTNARYLFGCSSVQTLKLPEIVALYHKLRGLSALSTEHNIKPLGSYDLIDSKTLLRLNARPEQESLNLPPLLMGYLKAGALIHGEPAYDHDFQCLDLFTILDCKQNPNAFLSRYLDLREGN